MPAGTRRPKDANTGSESHHGVGCYRNRQKAHDPDQFCFGERPHEANLWGCKKLNMPLSEWGGGWLAYGTFDSEGAWIFDKRRAMFNGERRAGHRLSPEPSAHDRHMPLAIATHACPSW